MATGSATVSSSAVGRRNPLPQLKVSVLKEGNLLKRQRGRSSSADLRRLKWQQRYFCLTPDYLCYYTDHRKGEKKGDFSVSRMKIIEKVPDATFHSSNCMQIGDEKEVTYLKAKTENERREWMEAFKIAASLKKTPMLEFYHIGAYGQVHQHKWSCCNAANRDTPGCQKTKVDRRLTTLIEDHDNGDSEIDLIDRRYSLATCPSLAPDAQSIASGDSGFLELGGSHDHPSMNSRQTGAGRIPSPSVHSKLMQETIPEHEQLKHSMEYDDRPEVGQNAQSLLLVQDSESEVTSAIFRGTDTLVVAHKDGSVQIIDTGNLDVKGAKFEYVSSKDSIGSVDVWKNFLAMGFLNLKLLNLNSVKARKTLQNEDEGDVPCHPYLVAFTPRGRLLSYNLSQPAVIKVWPKVETLWTSPNIESEGYLNLKDISGVDRLQVSPNPTQSWVAVTTTNAKQLQIYDYNKYLFKSQIEFADEEKTSASFSPDGENIIVGRGRTLTVYEVETSTLLYQLSPFDEKITSVAYNLWSRDTNLAIGFEDGQITVYNGLPNSPNVLVSLDSQKASEAITCLAFSKDGQTLAAGSSSGKVKLWREVPTRVEIQEIVLVREGELRANSKGKQYVSPVDGYVISIPPGAIPEGMTATFKHGIVPDGPFGSFKFPTGVRPVSAILSLHPTTEQPLLKPIDVALPHFIHCETQEDCQRLAVFKAKCTGDRGNGHGKQIYQFEQMTEVNLSLGTYYGDSKYPEGIPYAKYSTDHHCYLCIGEYRKEDIDKAIFSMIEVKPKVVDQFDNLVVHFCLPYFLPTCHQTIRDQYPDKGYELNIQSIKFSSDEGCDDPVIGINFRERLGDWLFSLQGGNDKKIYQEDVSFWDYPTPFYLKEMCQEKLYPPRFSVCIRGMARLNDVVRAEFTFPGAVAFPGRGEPVAIIHLPLPTQISRSSLSTGSAVSRVNSDCSISSETARAPPRQPTLQPVARAFKACMCDLDDLHPSKLAVNLFSKDLIDEAEFESIQESMKSTTKDEMVLRNEILFRVYNNLKAGAKLYTPLHEVLRKVKPETAQKFALETSRYDREGSVASTASLPNTLGPMKLSNQVLNESSTLTPHAPIHFQDDLMKTLKFHSPAPTDPCFMNAESTTEGEECLSQ